MGVLLGFIRVPHHKVELKHVVVADGSYRVSRQNHLMHTGLKHRALTRLEIRGPGARSLN